MATLDASNFQRDADCGVFPFPIEILQKNTIQSQSQERRGGVWLQQENLREGDASLGWRDVARRVSGATRTRIDGSPVFESSDMAGTLTHPNTRDRMCLSAIVRLALAQLAWRTGTVTTRLHSLRQCGAVGRDRTARGCVLGLPPPPALPL